MKGVHLSLHKRHIPPTEAPKPPSIGRTSADLPDSLKKLKWEWWVRPRRLFDICVINVGGSASNAAVIAWLKEGGKVPALKIRSTVQMVNATLSDILPLAAVHN
ncbi:uncharacterized protein CIMG_12895 [Coccidioides immitis RS]|uniref:Uncharacterized protein n=1 Tax=Coccidioides immitis (strain RS) TaxID=246410 RepID=A0A0D8JTA2_COCIM|nr:uncharacterized protein CIMG_12895 [Coccidioides immitis RS]KJF60349.1 hypothetical protein CIMG_12895 [Coccidioides immitis RS]